MRAGFPPESSFSRRSRPFRYPRKAARHDESAICTTGIIPAQRDHLPVSFRRPTAQGNPEQVYCIAMNLFVMEMTK